MRLERLEISGFKSFSDRSELAFDGGVTAIVGPNGCGKSNVADALTWVLGEQSVKSLRGEKMEDVIFSGSDARKPTGAAEVKLRLSGVAVPASPIQDTAPGDSTPAAAATNGNGHGNGNGHLPMGYVSDLVEAATREVEVTRRLYRSGESEYLIDGQHCRLRDIHELLMDTGLGAKAYAIIEQGKIGMILSSRPTDRRQLIEEAAGITKYKARRRSAELKLEAAQQNLTRVDDIVYEVEKQRGTLKRQAAKARRYKKLRDELRRWEKVLFARRYQHLGEAIESARARLAGAREQEAAASARLAEVETELTRLRIELAEAESAAAAVRGQAHARELEIERRQQQVALDRQQAGMLERRSTELAEELQSLEARREPERLRLDERRSAAAEADRARQDAAAVAAAAADDYARAQRGIEAVEHEVERARQEVYAVMNTVTALNAAVEAAASQRDRAAEALARLDAEASDLRTEHARATAARVSSADALQRAQEELESARVARAARETELASARVEHEWRAREVRGREHDLAGLTARLTSLEELDAHRAGYGDAARLVLAQANGHVNQLGALADYLEVEPRYERAVEACLGDLLQHVLVPHHAHARAGLALVREEGAGRCGFIIVDEAGTPPAMAQDAASLATSAVRLSSVIRLHGPYGEALRAAVGDAWIAESYDEALRLAGQTPLAVATLDGDVFPGARIVTGGGKSGSRGILATKREIKDLRERVTADRVGLESLAEETAAVEQVIAHASAAIAGLTAELHRQEKSIVGVEALLQRAVDDEARLARRAEMVASETRRVREEIAGLDERQSEARDAIGRLTAERTSADALLAEAQQRLLAARDAAEALSQAAAGARATAAGLVERSAAAEAEVQRLEDAARDLERRVDTCGRDLQIMREQRERLLTAASDGERLIDEDVRVLGTLREEMHVADDETLILKAKVDRQEDTIRDARRALDAVRALGAELDVTRATAEADLAHLARQCGDTVQATLDDVAAEVALMEREGLVEPDARAIRAEEPEDDADDEPVVGVAPPAPDAEAAASTLGAEAADAVEAEPARMTAEEAIAELKARIDRLGPVNILAIEQFDELETRHVFLTTQRQDLLDAIAQTNEAIKRIDETTHARFREAFSTINQNFQQAFATLFGGGRAGITLLDENDPLESGIDIVASPPGKRLQSVMLLSGGEKALTAIALMFAIFRYKPSPFCLLDEIDAPLDDANIGRFVEMLRGMMDRTQFIIITHNRKTMEIANRLYGVTMEEPGVSKLISIQMN